MEEIQQPLFPRRELSFAGGAMQGDHADGAVGRDLVGGRESIIDLGRPVIVVPGDRPIPHRVGHELPPGAGHESAAQALQSAKDGIAAGRQLVHVGPVHLATVRIEAGAEGRDGFECAMRPDPSRFAARCRWGPDEPAQSLEHPLMPESRVASQVTAVPDQPVGVAHILGSQEVRLGHRPIPLFRGIAGDRSLGYSLRQALPAGGRRRGERGAFPAGRHRTSARRAEVLAAMEGRI